jgi:hypothetical protein
MFKKRMQALMDLPRHKSYVPKEIDDPVYNMMELVELSKRYGAGFRIRGDHKKFTIVSKSLVLKGLVVMILCYLAFTITLAVLLAEPILWIITAVGVVIFALALKFGPLLFYNITVDTYTKKITVKSNNTLWVIGKWIRPGFEIDLSQFIKLSSEKKKRKSYAGEAYTIHYVNRVYIEYGQQKGAIIDFSEEINHHIFMICLTKLITKHTSY